LLTTPDSPILCYVTSRKALGLETNPITRLLAIIRRAIEAGVDWIQIREKDLSGRELVHLVREAVAAASDTQTKILVNDRLDVAIAARAGGVHLGAESIPIREVAAWRESHPAASLPNFLIGASSAARTRATAKSVRRDQNSSAGNRRRKCRVRIRLHSHRRRRHRRNSNVSRSSQFISQPGGAPWELSRRE
jgi:hypothetical protein